MLKERIITAGEGVKTPETARVGAVTFGAARLALGVYNDRAIDRSIPLKERVAQATPAILPHDAIATVSQDERRETGVSNDDFAKGLMAFKAKLGEREAMLRAPHIGGKGWTKEEEAALEPITDAVILMYHLGVTGNTLEEATRNINTNIRERYLGKQTDIKQLVEDVVKKYKEWSGPSWQDSLSRILDSEYTFLFFHAFGGKDTATLILDDIRARMLLDKDNQTGRAELNNTASQQDFFKPLEGDDKDAFAHLAKATGQDKPEVKAQTPTQPGKDAAPSPAQQVAEQPAVPARRTEAPDTTPQPGEQQEKSEPKAVPPNPNNGSELEDGSHPVTPSVEKTPSLNKKEFELFEEVKAKEKGIYEESRPIPDENGEKVPNIIPIVPPLPGENGEQKEPPVTWQVGVTEVEGRSKEDRSIVQTGFAGREDQALLTVLDGHLGPDVANFARTAIPEHLETELKQGVSPEEALEKSFASVQKDIEDKKLYAGAMVVTALIRGNMLYTAHMGDSRAMLIHDNNIAEQITTDHTIETNEAERKRVEERGATLIGKRIYIPSLFGKDSAGNLVSRSPSLPNSRAFGDTGFNGMLHEPEIQKRALAPGDKWLLLSSDGVWHVLNIQEAANLIKGIDDPQKASEILTDAARNPGKYNLTNPDGTPPRASTDDLTVIAVNLSQIAGLQEQRQ